jgi:IPT/TIG domain
MTVPTLSELRNVPRLCRHFVSRLARAGGLAALLIAGMASPSQAQVTWDFATDTPTSGVPANLSVGALSRGNNNGTTNTLLNSTSASNTYPGFSASNNAGAAARLGALDTGLDKSAYFEVTLTPASGFNVTLQGISFGTRSTGTGPQAYSLLTSADGFVAAAATGAITNNSAWAAKSNTGLALTSPTPLTLRIYGHNGASTGSPAANTTNWRIDDLVFTVSVGTSGGTPVTIATYVPSSGPAGTAVTITGTNFGAGPTVSFNGTPAPITSSTATSIVVNAPVGGTTGPITVSTTSNGSASTSGPYTYPAAPVLTLTPDATSFPENGSVNITVARPSDAPLASALTVSLNNSAPTKATVPASVIIPANDLFVAFTMTGIPDGVFAAAATATITASAPGYDNGTTVLTINNVDPPPSAGPTTVVVNKYFNAGSSSDTIELLVVGNGTAGTTLDMRGMILKDFASNMGTDGGGKYVFKDTPLLASVKVGTLLIVDVTGTSGDPIYTDSNDFTLRLSLADPDYFTKSGTGTFDISTTDMIMIKAATVGGLPTDPLGVVGSLHVLAAGVAGTQYNSVVGDKLIASGTTGTSRVVIANNSTSTLADYNGTDATGNLAQTDAAAFGNFNNATNQTYIRALRGITSASGTGLASIANDTAGSPYITKNIFPRNGTAQKVAITFTGASASPALGGVKITVPAAFGTPTAPNVSASGAGAGTPVITVTGQEVKITGTALTSANTLTVKISGLITPNPTALTDESGYPFPVETSESGTSFLPVSLTPVAAVLIPISSLRDVDASGIALDRNKIVAIQGVCTEAQFSNNAAGDTTAFIQDGDFGIGLFASALPLNLVRGNIYAISGPLSQFNGLSQLLLTASNPVVDRGAGTEPTPLTVSLADLLANAELYEGRVLKVLNLGSPAGSWASSSTVTLSDPTPTTIDIRIQAGSAATTPPASYPANITGILSQFDSSSPFSGSYQLMPRDSGDIEISAPPGYDTWAAAYPGIGAATVDGDGDGQSNYLEYALGTIPNDRSSVQQPAVAIISGVPTFSITKGSQAAVDPAVGYRLQASFDLVNWNVPPADLDFLESSLTSTIRYIGTPRSARCFFRLYVNPPP